VASKAPAVKAALFALCQTLYPAPIQVSYGHPGTDLESDIVSVAAVRATQEVATMSPQRNREETISVDVVFSCFAGGGPEVQQTVTERAYALCALLENYLQTTDYTLSGTARLARVTGADLYESDDAELLALGRLSELTATVHVEVRI
jgi:hypothetical protein